MLRPIYSRLIKTRPVVLLNSMTVPTAATSSPTNGGVQAGIDAAPRADFNNVRARFLRQACGKIPHAQLLLGALYPGDAGRNGATGETRTGAVRLSDTLRRTGCPPVRGKVNQPAPP